MRGRPLRRSVLVMVLVGALAAACGGNGGGEGEEADEIEEELGFDQAGTIQRQTRVENFVRDCMKAQGFDYTPVDPSVQRAALVGSATLSEEDFEKQFGYGLTTLYEQRQGQVGPNKAYRDTLDPVQRMAYDRALYGEQTAATFDEAIDTGDFTQLGGCTKQATEQVFGGAERLDTLQTKLDELETRIVADPRMVDAIRDWSACMREAGFSDLRQPEDVDTILKQKLEAIVGSRGATDYDRAALAALQREEVEMVKADIACERKHLAAVEDEVRVEYERTFREENADFLDSVPRP